MSTLQTWWRLRKAHSPAPSSCPYSPECVEGGFCELRLYGVLGSSQLPWYSDVLCAMAHIHLPQRGVLCNRQLIKVGSLALPNDGGRVYEAYLALGCGDDHGVGRGQRGRLGGHHSGH